MSAERQAARARSAAAWADFRDRLASVTPAGWGRVALAGAVAAVVVSLVVGTWPALLPFAVGGLIAYAILPVVDALDRVMPRALAAALSLLAILGVVVAVFAIVVPPLVAAILAFQGLIPEPAQIRVSIDQALSSMPASARDVVGPIAIRLVAYVEGLLTSASGSLDDLIPAAFQAALSVVGAVLGLLVLPAWVLTALAEKQRSAIALDRRTAGWLRPDFWAIVRMFDRAAGTYLRGYVVIAALVGILVWVGLTASARLGGPSYAGALALATFAGAVQVVPEVGPLLGFSPALLLLARGPEHALGYLAVYVVSRWLVGLTVGGRLMEDRLGVPRLILIPGVVALGQLGLLPLLLSAPILAFGTDLVRYLHGRLSEPPRPAGILPGEPVPPAPAAAAVPAARRIPAIYRRGTRPGAAAAAMATAPIAATPTGGTVPTAASR